MEVYKKVKSYIDEHGLDHSYVAENSGISATEFDAIMGGKRTMHADDLRSICLALNVSPELFIDIERK